MSNLPLIVGYGGINAAGRSIFDFSHQRMLFDSINAEKQNEVLQSLGHLMGTSKKEQILNKVLKGGKIYNPNDGNSYKAKLTLLKNNNLQVQGCVLFVCDGEEWQPLIVTFNPDGSRHAKLKNKQEN